MMKYLNFEILTKLVYVHSFGDINLHRNIEDEDKLKLGYIKTLKLFSIFNRNLVKSHLTMVSSFSFFPTGISKKHEALWSQSQNQHLHSIFL